MAGVLQSCCVKKGNSSTNSGGIKNTMTVMKILPETNDATFIKIVFKRSERMYKLAKNAKPEYLQLLKESEKNNTPVVIKRADEESEEILSVEKSDK